MVETTTEIFVELENTPGTLADASDALGEANVNITGFLLEAQGSTGTARFLTQDPGQARSALEKAGLAPQDREIVVTQVPNRPGQLAKLARALADSGVNIESSFPVLDPAGSQAGLAFAVDDIDSANKVLSQA